MRLPIISSFAAHAVLLLFGVREEEHSTLANSNTDGVGWALTFEAALNGANLRYRAVLMTAWSFLFGVFPLVIATGAGSGSRRAIGITTFSGMVLATLVGIVFTPALYAAFQRIREYLKSKVLRFRKAR